MINVNGYKSYFGGKSGSGTYQQIINHIPPHKVYMSLFLGNCGVTRHIKPAEENILMDKDVDLVASWKTAIQAREDLPAASQNYEIRAGNAIEFLTMATIAEKYDTAGTFIYLDPPYLIDSRKSKVEVYKHEMTRIDHELLLAAILKWKKARVMSSAYPNGLYDEVLTGWHTHDFYSKIRNGVALERLYMNYEIGSQLHDYSFIGGNFREREKHNRIKNNFLAKLDRLDPRLKNSILTDLASHIK